MCAALYPSYALRVTPESIRVIPGCIQATHSESRLNQSELYRAVSGLRTPSHALSRIGTHHPSHAFIRATPSSESPVAVPQVRNAAYRCPGRNLVPRRWPRQQQGAAGGLTQRRFELPSPFLGRSDTVRPRA